MRFLFNKIINVFHELFYRILNIIYPSYAEFYLIDSFEIYHFLPIYNKLVSKGYRVCFVAEAPEYNVLGNWFDYDVAIKVLKDIHVIMRGGCNSHATLAFSTQSAAILKKYKKSKKISVSYGLSFLKDYFMYSPTTIGGFDYRFVHGEYQLLKQASMGSTCRLIKFGFPKHNGERIRSKEEIKKDLGIKTEKDVLVYFPTWDDDCSVDRFWKEIKKLRNSYFIITKYHHCLERLPELNIQRDHITEMSDLTLSGNFSFAEAAMLADIAIIDAKSGASTEVPYINQNVKIVLLSMKNNIDEAYYPEIRRFAIVVNNEDDLIKAVKKIDKYKREEIMSLLYGDRDRDYLECAINEVIGK